jgi:hypothetical protein
MNKIAPKKYIDMKRKILIFVILLAGTGLLILQSCNKKEGTIFKSYNIFTEPVVVGPVDGAILNIGTGTTVNLQWTSESVDGDPIKANVYFGTSETPPLFKADHNALSLSVPVTKGTAYFWSIEMIDVNGIPTQGPTWSFTVFDIALFTGDFTCDEPAESYSYDVSFSKVDETTITTDNYWNSGWDANFTLNFTAWTYSMPLTAWIDGANTWSAEEAGTIDPSTGTIEGDYTIYKNGVAVETGVHTYTK